MKKKLITLFLFFFIIGTSQLILAKKNTYSNTDSLATQRLFDLCKVWGAVKYFHPEIAYGKIDWDKALVESIPKVEAATNKHEFQNALQNMLNYLNDPETRVVKDKHEKIIKYQIDTTKQQPYVEWLEDSIAVVVATDYKQFDPSINVKSKLAKVLEEVEKAKAIIFDLRKLTDIDKGFWITDYLFRNSCADIYTNIIDSNLILPANKWRYHYGFKDQVRSPSIYYSGFKGKDSQFIIPNKNTLKNPICFLANDHSSFDWMKILALKSINRIKIIHESNSPFQNSKGRIISLELSDSISTEIRATEFVLAGFITDLGPDSVVSVANSKNYNNNPTIEAAISLLKKPFLNKKKIKRPFQVQSTNEKKYSEMTFPNLEYRLLALFRYWNAIEYFFPYKDLIGENWENTLKEFIPKFSEASDSLEYNLCISELSTRIYDSHSRVYSNVLNEYWGTYTPPIKTNLIEGRTVITKIMNDSLNNESILQIGDEILNIDNESVTERRKHIKKYIGASNTPTLERNVDYYLFRGKKESDFKLTILRNNEKKEIAFIRNTQWWKWKSNFTKREGEIWKSLTPEIGYIDLDRLANLQVDSAFAALRKTNTMIFDMRGYPLGTHFSIAAKLTKEPVKAAKFIVPIVGWDPSFTNIQDAKYEYTFSELKPGNDKKYKGNIIVLVDENTQSSAEYICMIFQACAKTTIIGSTTSGADGNTTMLVLPGGINTDFTGMAVEYPDGRQTQRIGIIPDIFIKPTIQGIKEGRDEVLERAIEFYHNNR